MRENASTAAQEYHSSVWRGIWARHGWTDGL